MTLDEAKRIAAGVESRTWEAMTTSQTLTRDEYRDQLAKLIFDVANESPPAPVIEVTGSRRLSTFGRDPAA